VSIGSDSPVPDLPSRRPGLLERSRAAARAVPVSAWLGAIVVGSVAFRFLLSLRVHAPWIFQDEAVYFNLARSLGEDGHFAIRAVDGTGGFGVLYPALLAPAWALFSDPWHSYVAAKLISSLLLSLAAIPTYLIARRLMRPAAALVAALFAVAIPSLAYANTLLSENAFYPATMAAAATLFLLLERPTVLRQLAFFGFVLLAFLARAQGVILLAALAIALPLIWLLNARTERGIDRRVLLREAARFRVSLGILVGGVAAVAIYETARGRPIKSVLGTYSNVTAMKHPLGPTLRWTVEHFGVLDLYLGVIPFVAMVVFLGLGLFSRAALPADRAFAAAGLPLVLVYVGTAAAYAADIQGQRIEERYMFHIAPLFFVALMAWIDRGLPRPPVLTAIGVALGAGLAGVVPYHQRLTSDVVHDAFALVPLLSLELKGTLTPENVGVAVGICAMLGAAAAAVVRPRYAWLLPAAVLVFYAVIELRPIQRRIEQASTDAVRAGIPNTRNWVDRKEGGDSDVALLVNGGYTALPYWENDFFNRSVGKVYALAGPFDSLPRYDLAPTASGVLHDVTGKPIRQRYVLSNYQVVPEGRVIADDPGTGMTLYETKGPLRIKGTLVGLFVDRWSGGAALWTQYGCDGGTLTAHLLSDPNLFHRGVQGLTAQLNGKTIAQKRVPTTRRSTFSVPLPRRRGVCAVNFLVGPTAVPAQVLPGEGDIRELGIRFLGFDYKPAAR
jgi:hypothetical protein